MTPSGDVRTVTEVLQDARALLESRFPSIAVCGEITGFKTSGAGHMYFSLKDERSVLNCVFFRSHNEGLAFRPEDGMKAVASGLLTLYESRGQFQMNVRSLEPQGIGALQVRYEQLKRQLAAEGLFDASRKRELPCFPRRVALVTSPQGAAIQDFRILSAERHSIERIDLFPVKVQGAEAPAEIVSAFREIRTGSPYDVVVLTRGGGSLEDLAAFNDESVVRAVAACPFPVVSAVGHETDFTLADFAADVRAATPSAAAALLGPTFGQSRERMDHLSGRLRLACSGLLDRARESLSTMRDRFGLGRPDRVLEDARQDLDENAARLARALAELLRVDRHRLDDVVSKMKSIRPDLLLHGHREHLDHLVLLLRRDMGSRLKEFHRGLERSRNRLEVLHPLAPLERGYALVTRERDGKVVRDPREAPAGSEVGIRLARGRLKAVVKRSRPEPEGPSMNPATPPLS